MFVFVNDEPWQLKIKDPDGKDITERELNPKTSCIWVYYEEAVENSDKDDEAECGKFYFERKGDRLCMSERTFEFFKRELKELEEELQEDRKFELHLLAIDKGLVEPPKPRRNRWYEEDDDIFDDFDDSLEYAIEHEDPFSIDFLSDFPLPKKRKKKRKKK